ncbi:MAG: DeoR/GlpR transcriptional regulator [Bacteroidetes bacterium]|nr:DeoR/GlpR transcriptional regulator [Bacteroidota bacterium]
MLKKERQAHILHQLNIHNRVSSSWLSESMQVSEDTIRRDLQELAESGKVIKVHGGALSLSFSEFNINNNPVYGKDEKQRIARKAISLIKNNMVVLTSGGTTIIELAKSLPRELKATFISGSIPAILEYCNHPNIDVIVIGDKISKNSKITIGADAIAKIKSLRVDICFLGINAIDVQHGVSDDDWDVAQLKKVMIESAQKVAALAISEKIDTFQPISICPLQNLDYLITELDPDDERLEPYKKNSITLI